MHLAKGLLDCPQIFDVSKRSSWYGLSMEHRSNKAKRLRVSLQSERAYRAEPANLPSLVTFVSSYCKVVSYVICMIASDKTAEVGDKV